MRKRGVTSPDDGDALALTFAYPVASNDPVDLSIALQPTMLVQVKQHPSEIVCAEFPFKSCCPKLIGIERCHLLPRSLVRWHQAKAREGICDVFAPAKVAVPVTTHGAGEAASRREGSTILGIAPVPVAKILARCRPPRTRETAVPASSFLRQRLISQGTQAIRRTPPRLPL